MFRKLYWYKLSPVVVTETCNLALKLRFFFFFEGELYKLPLYLRVLLFHVVGNNSEIWLQDNINNFNSTSHYLLCKQIWQTSYLLCNYLGQYPRKLFDYAGKLEIHTLYYSNICGIFMFLYDIDMLSQA